MKRFYFTKEEKQKNFGRLVSGKIFKHTRDGLVYCCDYSFNTSSCRGLDSEVFQALLKNKFIPEKYRGEGYYSPRLTPNIDLVSLNGGI